MRIRPINKGDVSAIIELVNDNLVSRDSNTLSGLLEYSPNSVDWWMDKLVNNKFSYLIEDEGSIAGFLSAYDLKFLKKHDFKGDEIISYLLKNHSKNNFVYCDLIVIKKEFRKKGFAKNLLISFLDDVEDIIVYGAIAHKPWKNELSIKTISRFEFKLIEEIIIKENLIFGIYKKGV